MLIGIFIVVNPMLSFKGLMNLMVPLAIISLGIITAGRG